MRSLSWLHKQAQYIALVPVPEEGPGPLDPGLFGTSSADDCEAFLAGGLVEYRMDHHQLVSVSDWTNLLAHGTEANLMDEVANCPRPGTRKLGKEEWREARWYLAATLLHRVKDQEALERIRVWCSYPWN